MPVATLSLRIRITDPADRIRIRELRLQPHLQDIVLGLYLTNAQIWGMQRL